MNVTVAEFIIKNTNSGWKRPYMEFIVVQDKLPNIVAQYNPHIHGSFDPGKMNGCATRPIRTWRVEPDPDDSDTLLFWIYISTDKQKNNTKSNDSCYLLAKKHDDKGCLAIQVKRDKALAGLVTYLGLKTLNKGIQMLTLTNTDMYGEYKPYHFVDSEVEFIAKVLSM